MSKYFLVTDSEMSAALDAFQKGRTAVIKARHNFADKHFPGCHEIEHYEGLRWSVVYKADDHGRTTIPDYMKFDKGSGRGCSPLKKTAKGKELASLMADLEPLQGHHAAAKIIGLNTFQVIDGQLANLSPGVSRVKHGEHKGKFLITLSSGAKFDAKGCERISDVEAEAIQKPAKKKKAATK
jgi:hypothetical protein